MKKRQYLRRFIYAILIVMSLLIGIAVVFLSRLIVAAYQVDVSLLEEPLPKPTVIIDRNGEAASELSSARFTSVPLSRIPNELIHAIIAVEDQRFFEHSGVDFRGISRSAWRNFRAGAVVQGGSTITQQLAKNLFFTSDRTYTRKFNEVITAYRIEREYSKEAILELYLNQIYFGEGTWGIQDAAKTYFGKDIQEITVAEAALLAALPKAPTHYSPFQNEQKAMERRNLVLYLLHEQGYITKEEYEKAFNEEIVLRDWEIEGIRGKYPSYVDYVLEEAIHKYGFSEEYILTGGLHIFTQMDPQVQSAIEAAYTMNELFPESTSDDLVQSASAVIDPASGGVRGLIGYRGQHVYRGFNRATQLKRQPGSAIKPLAVFAPALEHGYRPTTMLLDEKTDFNGYSPRNFNDRYRGRVTMYEALLHSLNVPAVALLNDMGVGVGVDFLERSSIPLVREDRNLSIALGGFTEGVSPLEMAQAFSMFPNLGTMKKAHAITRITSSTGEILLEVVEEEVQVMKPENAYTMTEMMMGVVQDGTGKNAVLDRPTAGKTGTTQLPRSGAFEGVNGVKDAWFVGYTPELVTAVWMGYDKIDPINIMETTGGNHPAKVFQAIMTKSLEGLPISAFEKPKNYREEVTSPPAKNNEKNEGNKNPGKGNEKGKSGKGNEKEKPGKGNKKNDKGKGKGKGKD